jgi:hypothetical protein
VLVHFQLSSAFSLAYDAPASMVVQDKKAGGIRICVDLRKLNDTYFLDPFSTPIIDEVL